MAKASGKNVSNAGGFTFRPVQGDEMQALLSAKGAARSDYSNYLNVLSDLSDGDVIAVTLQDEGDARGEKIRFARAASQGNHSLSWLQTEVPNEIAFQYHEAPRPKRQTSKNGTNAEGVPSEMQAEEVPA